MTNKVFLFSDHIFTQLSSLPEIANNKYLFICNIDLKMLFFRFIGDIFQSSDIIIGDLNFAGFAMACQEDKIRWLSEQLSQWTNANIIDETASGKIRSLYPPPKPKTTRPWAVIAFSCIGACVIGLGVILLLAYNWDDMTKAVKLSLIFASIIISHSVGITIFLRSQKFKALGEGLTLLGTILFGAGIFLIAQIYHIDEHYPNAFLFWGIGAFLMAWAMPSIAQAIIAAIILTFWAIFEGVDFGTSMPYTFALLGLLLPLAYKKRNGLCLCVILLAIAVSTIFVVAACFNSVNVFVSLLSLFTAYTAIGILHQKSETFAKFGSVYRAC